MSATATGRRPRTYRPRDFPRVFAVFTRIELDDDARQARESANTYKRQSLRLAFEAGWNLGSRPALVVKVCSCDLMSDLGKSALYAGAEARLLYDNPPPQEDHDG